MSQLQVSGEAKIRDIQGPVVANSGVITALDGAASQYVRGDGTLADFPTSTGGGSSVSYYLNSSVSQGTIGGVAYRELSKEPIIGAGTDITISANGYVASYITDANDPDVLSVPGGNFNCEFYFSVNNNTGNPTTYAELYKYDGTTFTILGSSVGVPESLNQGTTIAPYYFAIPVATAALALTDRLAIRIYVSVDGRVVTLHTENSHLCQVVTTFSKGMVSLNNLTDQSQFITTGTSGTDFNIVSSGDTHTFNIPSASASNRGLITTGNQTIAGNKIFTAGVNVDNLQVVNSTLLNHQAGLSPTLVGTTAIGGSANGLFFNVNDNGRIQEFIFDTTGDRDYTFPAASGTLALTSDISYPVSSVFGRTGAVVAASGDYTTTQVTEGTNLYYTDARARGALSFTAGSGAYNSTTGVITIPTNTNQLTNGASFITLGSLSGGTGISYNNTTGVITNSAPDQTVALTASTGISISGTYPNFTITNTSPSSGGTVTSVGLSSATSGVTIGSSPITTSGTITLAIATASGSQNGLLSSTDWTTFNNKQSALTNPVTGTGTTNYLPKFTGTSTIGNSIITESSGTISITNSSVLTSAMASPQLRLINNATATINQRIDLGLRWEDGTYNGIGGISMVRESATARSGRLVLSGINSSGDPNEAVIITSTGNLGLGVTPSAWATYPAMQISRASFWGAADNGYFGTNYYWDGSTRRYINSNFANELAQVSGEFRFYTAPSGTAGNAISFTQAMTLDASGRLALGRTSADHRLDLQGNALIRNSLGNASFYFAQEGDNSSTLYQYNNSTLKNVIASNGVSYFNGGNVLIGTTTDAGYKLDVNGTARVQGDALYVYSTGNIELGRDTTYSIPYMALGFGGRSNSSNKIFAARDTTDGIFINSTTGRGITMLVNGGATTALTIASTGAATFSSSVNIGNATIGSRFNVKGTNSNSQIEFDNFGSGVNYILSYDRVTPSYKDVVLITNSSNNTLYASTSGNVGIGTSSPLSKLHVNGTMQVGYVDASNTAMEFYWNGASSYGRIQTYSSSALALNPLGNNVLIGTTINNGSKLQVLGGINVKGNDGYNGWIISQTGGSASAAFNLSYGAGGAQNVITAQYDTGATTISSNNTAVGLTVNGGNGSDGTVAKFARGGAEKNFYISCTNNQYVNLGTEGDFRFKTGVTVDQPYATGVDAMVIKSNGNVLIGTTTDESYKLYVNGGSANAGLFYTTSAANQIKAAGTAPAITFTNTITSPTIGGTLGAATSANQFLTGTSAGDVVLINNYSGNRVYVVSSSGGVYLTSGATSWTANSDIRLKNINSHIENAVEKLSTLQTINFSYKDDKNNKQNLGLIAQEVEKIFPELIDKNGDDMLGVRYTELVPVLIKAIQELKLEIDELKLKIK